ncbi:MAG: DNA polymerase I [Spirochaetia bacterium]|nr:DNA polymerase I [Spirochaetia bacterium]
MTKSDNTVYILDSYGLIFRCYFAFISRPLTNSKGENISALFGFFRNLHWIMQHYKPGYLIAAMDSKTKTFRHEMYPEYKATRNKTPEDLHAQIPWICDILTAMGIPVLQCDGYEADDIIATVAKKCEAQGRNCKILSGDKDLMQLVTQTTQLLKPESGASTWKITGIEGVEAEWGVKPSQLLDLLSLYGDTADNIPGVHGVGVKTAAKLLNDYQNLDGIYEHIEDLKGAMKQKLIDGKESAYFSQKLVKLFDEVPCTDIDDVLNHEPYVYNFNAAAELLFKYEANSVAKSYTELGLVSNLKNTVKENIRANHLYENSEENKQTEIKDNFIDTQVIPPSAPVITKNDTSNYKAVTKLSDLESYITEYLSKKNVPIAYDCETDSLETTSAAIVGFSLCYEKGNAIYVPLQQKEADLFSETNYIELKDGLTQLLRIFTDPQVTLIMHNAKFDLKVFSSQFKNHPEILKNCSLPVSNYELRANLVDTMIAAWILNPEMTGKSAYGLEYLSEIKLGLSGIEFDQIVSKGQTFKDVPLEQAVPYAAEDADFTLQLWNTLSTELKSNENLSKLFYEIEMPVLKILTQMELTGIHLDSANLNSYNKELTLGIAEAQAAIYKEVGHEFNIASPKQLQTVLFDELNLPKGKKTKTGYSTDTTVLEDLASKHPVPKMILEFRELAKLQSTYVETLPKLVDNSGRIHTSFIQTGTATGRLSCRDPNLQNIPVRSEAGRKIRSAFTAPEGKVLISADYAQIELVVLAHLSGDKNMSQAFINGTDVHKATAALIYGVSPDSVTPEMRRTAKTINFGVIYGMSAFRLANDLEISRTEAANFIDSYFRMYADVNNFITNTVLNAEKTGYIETIFGRKRPVLNINSRNKIEKNAAERIAVNSPVQGSAADIVKKAMIDVSNALKETHSPAKLLLQVHDELIFECPDDSETVNKTIALIKEKMENAVKLNVPLRVSIESGKSWGEFH